MSKKIISVDVKLKTKGSKRSPKWTEVRKKFLKTHPTCACCGSKKFVEVHHIQPFYIHPELELVSENLITLCESKPILNCHLIIGHGGNYRDVNPDVVIDADHFYELLTEWQTPKFEGTQNK